MVVDEFSSSQTVNLLVEKVPFDLTEDGLKNYIKSKYFPESLVYLRVVRSRHSTLNISYITVASQADAQKFIKTFHDQPPLHLSVKLLNFGSDSSPQDQDASKNMKASKKDRDPIRKDAEGKTVFTYNNPITLPELQSEELPACICGAASSFVCRKCYLVSYCSVQCARDHIVKGGHDQQCSEVTYQDKDWLLKRLSNSYSIVTSDDSGNVEIAKRKLMEPGRRDEEILNVMTVRSQVVEPKTVEKALDGKSVIVGTRESYISDSELSDVDRNEDSCCLKLLNKRDRKELVIQKLRGEADHGSNVIRSHINMDEAPSDPNQGIVRAASIISTSSEEDSKVDSDSSDSMPFTSAKVLGQPRPQIKKQEIKKVAASPRIALKCSTVQTQTVPIIMSRRNVSLQCNLKKETHDMASQCADQKIEKNDAASEVNCNNSHLLPMEWTKVDLIKSINCGDSTFSFIVIVNEKPFFADLTKYTLSKSWDSDVSANLDYALAEENVFVKRITQYKNIIKMKLGNDVSVSKKLLEIGLIDIGASTGQLIEPQYQLQSVSGTLDVLAHSSPKKDYSIKNLLDIKRAQSKALASDSNPPPASNPTQYSSRRAAVVLQDGMKVLLYDIGDTSQVARVMCCVEPDRDLIEEIMLRPEHRQPMMEFIIGTIVSVKNNDPKSRLPRYLRGEIVKVMHSKMLVTCKLLDHADEMTVGFDEIFSLPFECLHIPPLCLHLILTGVPSVPREEALPKIREHKYALSKELVLRIIDETEKRVELFDEKGKSVNKFIKKILTSDVPLPIKLPELTEKLVRNPWNERLFTEASDLNMDSLSSYQLMPVGTVFRATVLNFLSPKEFFLCSEELFRELKQFQINIQYMADHTDLVTNVELKATDMKMFKAEDGCWYRGIVRRISRSTGQADIYCPDYGFSVTVKIDVEEKDANIQPLYCKELSLIKYFASNCKVDEEVNLRNLQTVKVNILSFDATHMKYLVKIVP